MEKRDLHIKQENGVDDESESDEDIESNSNLNAEVEKLFVKCECTGELRVTGGYILHLDSTKESSPNIIVTTSKKSCMLYNIQNSQFATLQEYTDFKQPLIGCKFSGRDSKLFYTGTSDGCIKLFDLRTPKKPAFQFTDTTAEGKYKSFNCFDVSSNDRLLAAGTDRIDSDAFILFWDTRKHNVLGGYWEGHTDDITAVKFHPEKMDELLSGSVDGLINLYNLTKTSEDDALTDTLNTESSVDQLSWFNNNGKFCISCITHTSDLQLWDIDGCEPYYELSRSSISEQTQRYVNDIYLTKCHESRDGLLLLAGANAGNEKILRGFKLKKKTCEPFIQLTNNKQRVRDSSYDNNNNMLITGGEKGLLNVWRVPKTL